MNHTSRFLFRLFAATAALLLLGHDLPLGRFSALEAGAPGLAFAGQPNSPDLPSSPDSPDSADEGDPPYYLGSPACRACHAEIYERFTRSSKKAVTWQQVEKMQPKLSPEEQQTCFRCHATGYGQRGGFVSYAQTPDLSDVGCETCHGPGSRHAAQRDKAHIQRKPDMETCYSCHTPDRNQRSGFTPLLYGGAH